MGAAQGRLVISLVASALDTVVTARSPIVEGELPLDGSRFEGAIPPVCSAPTFSIRKKASRIFSLNRYVEQGIMPAQVPDLLIDALTNRKNILVTGGTGSGKTTLVNALIRALSDHCPDDRLVILEDTMELQSKSPNTQFFRTSDEVDMTRLLRVTMRMRPDRILIGEVRDGAALALLKSWNTGHPGGIATVHANSAEEGLYRLEELIAEATPAVKHRLIGQAVNLIVHIERAPGGRRIAEVLRVKNYDNPSQHYRTESLYRAATQ
jgi:type IV secretion system protein VirB11